MGKELSVARSEDARWSVLLAITGAGGAITTSSYRNTGQAKTTITKGKARGKAKGTAPKGKAGSNPKGTNAGTSKHKGHRQGHKGRKPDGRTEGTASQPRWSAKELGIEWPGSYCPSGEPHHLVEVERHGTGSLFRCIKCLKHKWLPFDYADLLVVSRLVHQYGLEDGYRAYLDKHSYAKMLIAKLQYLWYARQASTDNLEFARLADRVLSGPVEEWPF